MLLQMFDHALPPLPSEVDRREAQLIVKHVSHSTR